MWAFCFVSAFHCLSIKKGDLLFWCVVCTWLSDNYLHGVICSTAEILSHCRRTDQQKKNLIVAHFQYDNKANKKNPNIFDSNFTWLFWSFDHFMWMTTTRKYHEHRIHRKLHCNEHIFVFDLLADFPFCHQSFWIIAAFKVKQLFKLK